MANKECTVFVIDLGATTANINGGREETDLKYGMRYVWDKIGTIMQANRVGWSVGVIGLRTDSSNNDVKKNLDDANDQDGAAAYANISVIKPPGPMHLSHLKDLQEKIKTNGTNEGDAISAIVVAIDMIDNFTMLKSGKPAKTSRKIVLLTDGQGSIEDDDISQISSKLNDSGIDLVVM
jgi:ATP-dependent DNA helicase 2 subunit 2